MTNNEKWLKELEQMIEGGKSFKEICKRFEGMRIYFSSGPLGSGLQKRNEEIKKDFFSGMKQGDLAEKYGISYSQVKRIINDRE